MIDGLDQFVGRTQVLKPGSCNATLAGASLGSPGVVFALRFSNEDGFVQKFFAEHRDLAAAELAGVARCFMTYKTMGPLSVYKPQWTREYELDFYDFSEANAVRLAAFVAGYNIKVVVFQGAAAGEIDLKLFKRLGVYTINTEDSSFGANRSQSWLLGIIKSVSRSYFKRQVHDLHIANSQGNYQFLENFAKLPTHRLRVVHCGIDLERYQPGDRGIACAMLGLDPNITWLLCAAQSRPEKRVDRMIDAVKQVRQRRPDKRIGFMYVGDGWMHQDWSKHATKELGHDFRLFGRQQNLTPFYQAASLFMHGASKESFGLVLVEAMACALPVVATSAHGPDEIVISGRTGSIIGRDDWDQFANALLRYIDSPELRDAHGKAGRARCIELFEDKQAARRLAACIAPFAASPPATVRRRQGARVKAIHRFANPFWDGAVRAFSFGSMRGPLSCHDRDRGGRRAQARSMMPRSGTGGAGAR